MHAELMVIYSGLQVTCDDWVWECNICETDSLMAHDLLIIDGYLPWHAYAMILN